MSTSLNHLTFGVSDLQRSVRWYQKVLGARLLVHGDDLAYFDLLGIWLALNLVRDAPPCRPELPATHVALTASEEELDCIQARLQEQDVSILPDRSRDLREGRSIYLADPDGHVFEFHTGDRSRRLAFYRSTRKDLTFHE